MSTRTVSVERDRNGWVVAFVDSEGRRIKVLRDRHGLISGFEGPAPAVPERDPFLHQVAEVVATLVERVAEVEQATRTADEAPDGENTATSATSATSAASQDGIDGGELRALRKVLEGHLLRMDGLVRVDDMAVNERVISQAARSLGVTYPVTVEWVERDDFSVMDEASLGWYTFTPETLHVIYCRRGLGVDQTQMVLSHELAHAAQLERLREDFPRAYAEGKDDLEAEAKDMADRLKPLKLVRAA